MLKSLVSIQKFNSGTLNGLSKTLGQEDFRNYIWKLREKRTKVFNHLRALSPQIPLDEALAIINSQD